MTITIQELTSQTEFEYEALVADAPAGLLYHSLKYRNFLRTVLPGARDRYLIAHEDSGMVAALPCFVK